MKKQNLLSYLLFFVLLSVVSCKKNTVTDQPIEVVDSMLLNTKILLDVFGFENTDGNLAVAIYNSSESFNSETVFYLDTTVSVDADNMYLEIDSMDAGTYAISILHDEDESGSMEMGGFLNLIPQEGFGFSNNPEIGISEPSFNECKFEIEQGQAVSVPVTLIYM